MTQFSTSPAGRGLAFTYGGQIRGAHAEAIAQNGLPCEVELAEAILRQIVPVLVRVSSKMRVVREPGLMTDRKMTVG
jgi:hypothetical protein